MIKTFKQMINERKLVPHIVRFADSEYKDEWNYYFTVGDKQNSDNWATFVVDMTSSSKFSYNYSEWPGELNKKYAREQLVDIEFALYESGAAWKAGPANVTDMLEHVISAIYTLIEKYDVRVVYFLGNTPSKRKLYDTAASVFSSSIKQVYKAADLRYIEFK